jgi:hypothetical protein
VATEKIKLVVPGLATKEGQEKVSKALNERQKVDYECYMLLKRFLDGNYESTQEFESEARELVQERERINDQFIRAATGRE